MELEDAGSVKHVPNISAAAPAVLSQHNIQQSSPIATVGPLGPPFVQGTLGWTVPETCPDLSGPVTEGTHFEMILRDAGAAMGCRS